MNLDSILKQFRKFFPSQWLNSLARQTGLIKRSSSKFDGVDMCQLLIQAVNAPTELSLDSFCKKLYQINRNAKLKAQSLWERIVNPAALIFVEKIYAKTWALYAEGVKKDCSKYSCKFFEQFSQILIEDSTIVALNEKLSSFFKGSGGSASKSSLKIHLIFDAISNTFRWLKIHKDKRPDIALAYDVLPLITKGALIIRDLGFFILDVFNEIKIREAFFISRLHLHVNVYLSAHDAKPIDLVKYINKHFKLYSCGSLNVFLGAAEKLPVRLIFYRAPQDVINERKRKVKRNRQRKGGTASDHVLVWQEFTFLITNLPEEMVSPQLVGTIYRLRWDIELIFKNWKSHLHVNVLQGTRPERIEVLLCVKMISILLLGMICNHLKIAALKIFGDVEISETKVAKFLISLDVLIGLFKGHIKSEFVDFMNDKYWIKQFCKQKRKRKTTFERIKKQESFGTHQALA